MKSKHIKKETAERLREDFHTDLMDLIEEAIDIYGEKDFERGYQSFFGDSLVHAERIGAKIRDYFNKNSHIDDVENIIEEYFNSLKNATPSVKKEE